MTSKKLLNLATNYFFKRGPSLVLGLFYLLTSSVSFGMCNFPHNPAALCAQVVPTSHTLKNGKCQLKARVVKVKRPAGVYRYDDSLKRIDFQKPEAFKTEPQQIIYGTKEFCNSQNVVDKKKMNLLIKLNCYDEDTTIPDYAWRAHTESSELIDPWTKKKMKIDCSFLSRD